MHQAIVLAGQDQAASALEKIKLTLKGREAILGPKHPDTCVTLSWLGEIMRTQLPRHERSQSLDTIDSHHHKAVDGLTLILGADHHLTLESKTHMAAARRERGNSQGFKDAEFSYRQVYHGFKRTRGEEHVETLRAKIRLADVMHLLGASTEEVRRMWREATAGMAVTCGIDGYDTLVAHKGYEKFSRGLKD